MSSEIAGPKDQGIKAIFFDMNGTLRTREPHEPTQRAAIARALKLLGKEHVPDSYWEELARRHGAYGHWAQENLLQLSEEEIWTRWILPDEPCERIGQVAAELTLAWSERKGRPVPRPAAAETLAALKQRGYRLGVISNSMSSLDIPRSLESFGWNNYFDVVILSAFFKRRKPAPEPFLEAARKINIQPACCAYVGNRVSKDIVGCKLAGFSVGIVVEWPDRPHPAEQGLTDVPDAVIQSLSSLLKLFPAQSMSAGRG